MKIIIFRSTTAQRRNVIKRSIIRMVKLGLVGVNCHRGCRDKEQREMVEKKNCTRTLWKFPSVFLFHFSTKCITICEMFEMLSFCRKKLSGFMLFSCLYLWEKKNIIFPSYYIHTLIFLFQVTFPLLICLLLASPLC